MNKFKVNDKQILYNVHSAENCKGDRCVIHKPTDHHLKDWMLYWRSDRQMFERICPCHGVGHPDPDNYFEDDMEWIHNCPIVELPNGQFVGCCSSYYAIHKDEND